MQKQLSPPRMALGFPSVSLSVGKPIGLRETQPA